MRLWTGLALLLATWAGAGALHAGDAATDVEGLLKALEGGDGRARAKAAEELAVAEGAAIVPALTRRLEVEQDFHVRLALAYALAAQGEKRGLEVLVDALKEPGHLGYVYLTRVSGGEDFGWNRDGSSLVRWREWLAALDETAYRAQAAHARLPKEVRQAGWTEFLEAVTMLQDVGDRAKAAQAFRKVVTSYPQSDYAPDAKELADLLDGMAKEDKAWKEPSGGKSLPLAKKVPWLVHHLRNVNCYQPGQPGWCSVLVPHGGKKPTMNAAIELQKLGKPVLPFLLDLLEDRRPLRSVGYWRDFGKSRTVLRYQDAAIEIVNALLPAKAWEPANTDAYFSKESPARRKKVIEEVRFQVLDTAGKSPAEVLWLSVPRAPIYSALEMLDTLAVVHDQKEKVLAELQAMYAGKRAAIFRPAICEQMAKLGDLSKVEEVLRALAANEYMSHLIQEPDDAAASINADQAARRIRARWGPGGTGGAPGAPGGAEPRAKPDGPK